MKTVKKQHEAADDTDGIGDFLNRYFSAFGRQQWRAEQ